MAGNIRERKPVANGSATSSSIVGEKPRRPQSQEPVKQGFGVLDILRLVFGLILLNSSLSYFITNDSFLWGYRPWFVRPKAVMRWLRGPINLTPEQLALYNGTDPSLPIYLALNHTIYDVTAGARIYGPGGSYNIFAGKDATRGFITGCFAEDSTPDLRGVEWTYVPINVPPFDELDGVKVGAAQKIHREQELRKARKKVKETIDGWAKMFNGEGKKGYFAVGKVVREEGWLEKLPMPTLCASAEKGRPKPKEAASDPGKAHRGI